MCFRLDDFVECFFNQLEAYLDSCFALAHIWFAHSHVSSGPAEFRELYKENWKPSEGNILAAMVHTCSTFEWSTLLQC